ncbi:MAG: beta-ketoacyl synthase N-terminal-like domain-containing protein, partial [Planctomycetota bacterium]
MERVGVASDGKGKGLWAPRSEGQQLAIRRAATGSTKELDVDYLECHATSTQIGDATELESLTAILSEQESQCASPNQPLLIGSVKSNLGHLLEAAGLVGLVKCLIGMRRGVIPQTIHFENPTRQFDWPANRLRVVDHPTAWPETSPIGEGVQRAAVNAFGIGGLNAHVSVSRPVNANPARNVTSSVRKASASTDKQPSNVESEPVEEHIPMAIVGRGIVVAGGTGVTEFERLLRCGKSAIGPPPASRMGHATRHGGYVSDFQFDAQAYRIPPKLIAHANPAQLMLVDATSQALAEMHACDAVIDPKRIGVVIGTQFGGEFSNALQVGLRLPEIKGWVSIAAAELEIESKLTDQLIDQMGDQLFNRYGALRDETGGFTASTLASRLTRTFDWMGGACAVDADEASGGLALLTASEILQAKQCDLVAVGIAQRSMDEVAWQQLQRKYQPDGLEKAADCSDAQTQICPGEGVAIMLCRRLPDAIADGQTVLGVIDGLQEGFVANPSFDANASNPAREHRAESQRLASQIGDLRGGHGFVRALAETLLPTSKDETRSITETAADGYQIRYRIGTSPVMQNRSPTSAATSITSANTSITSANTKAPAREARTDDSVQCVRIDGSSIEQIAEQLQSIASGPTEHWATAKRDHDYLTSETQWRRSALQAAVVGESPDQLAAAARDLLDGPVKSRQTGTANCHAGFLRVTSPHANTQHLSRTAWLFPGQGSQYAERPAWADLNDGTLKFLDRFDALLQSRGLEGIAHRLDDPDKALGRDVWWTQLWVLGVGMMMTDAMSRLGWRPDVVLGHSFGECTAAWCAGSLTMEQSIEFTKLRSDAVVVAGRAGGAMLSIRATPVRVAALLQALPCANEVSVSHQNAPNQTVISGDQAAIDVAKKHITQAGIACIEIAVPAAFHTASMHDAETLLRSRFSGTSLRPPRLGVLSAISNRYLAEPADIRDNLVGQLTRPV